MIAVHVSTTVYAGGIKAQYSKVISLDAVPVVGQTVRIVAGRHGAGDPFKVTEVQLLERRAAASEAPYTLVEVSYSPQPAGCTDFDYINASLIDGGWTKISQEALPQGGTPAATRASYDPLRRR